MASKNRSTKGKEIPRGARKLLAAFRHIPSKTERRALVVLAEGIAFGRLAK